MHNRIYSKIYKNIYRPDWLNKEVRHKKKLWLDKNENTDKKLTKYINLIEYFFEDSELFSFDYKYL